MTQAQGTIGRDTTGRHTSGRLRHDPGTTGKLVIATHNSGKLREIAALLAPYGLTCIAAGELGLAEPAETGTSFAENALIKATAAAQRAGLPALADDSGLCVPALAGRPGVTTADWAARQWFEGEPGKPWQGRDWYLAMGKVEGLLAEKAALAPPGEAIDRSAYFVCVLALAWPDGAAATYEGRVEGHLVWPPRGGKGFGYDPMFVAEGHDHTFAELEPDHKHAISHRADAFAKLVADQFAG